MYNNETCPKCNSDLDEWSLCRDCGWMPQDEQICPRCFNGEVYDAEAVFCHNCGYKGILSDIDDIEPVPSHAGEELLGAVELVEQYEKMKDYNSFNHFPQPWQDNPTFSIPYKSYTPEPYQPFFDLVEDLKKWHVKVAKTSEHGLNGWLSRQTSKVAGVDVTHMAKAFGPFVFIPDYQWGTKSGYLSLVHEATHAKDFWKFGVIPFFLMQYVLPFGPSFTALLEYRAYVAGFKAEKKVWGYIPKNATERVANALASRPYRFCFPWPKLMKKLLDRAIGD